MTSNSSPIRYGKSSDNSSASQISYFPQRRLDHELWVKINVLSSPRTTFLWTPFLFRGHVGTLIFELRLTPRKLPPFEVGGREEKVDRDCIAGYGPNGLTTFTPAFSKSARLRVTTVRP
jgi:hypothetical protein